MLATWKERLKAAAFLGSGLFLVALVVATANLVVFGSLFSPYMKHLGEIGFSFANYPFKLYQIFLDGNIVSTTDTSSILVKMPWLVLMVPGAALVIRRYGVPAIAWLVAVTAMVCFYLSANGMIPSNFWDYHGYRYLAGWVPFTVLFSYLSLSRAWRVFAGRALVGGLAAGMFLPAVVGWQAVVVGQGSPAAQVADEAAHNGKPLIIRKQSIDKSLFVTVQFPEPTPLDGMRLQFERGLMVPVDSSLSRRVSVKVDGRPLAAWREFMVQQEPAGTVMLLFPNPPVSRQRFSQFDILFDGIDNDSLVKVTGIRAEFRVFGYLTHVFSVLRQLVLEEEVTAYLVPTPWDLTGSAAGVPDGQLDFGIDCDLPSRVKSRLADMELLVHSGNVSGKWATHSRGMNWDKLVFVPGHVKDNLSVQHPQIITSLPEILKRSDKFTILFKFPETYGGLPLTLVGLDREGQQVFVKAIAGIKR